MNLYLQIVAWAALAVSAVAFVRIFAATEASTRVAGFISFAIYLPLAGRVLGWW